MPRKKKELEDEMFDPINEEAPVYADLEIITPQSDIEVEAPPPVVLDDVVEELPVVDPVVSPPVQEVFDNQRIKEWFKYAHVRRLNRWSAIRVDFTEDAIPGRQIRVGLKFLIGALEQNGSIYVPKRFINHMATIHGVVFKHTVDDYLVYTK